MIIEIVHLITLILSSFDDIHNYIAHLKYPIQATTELLLNFFYLLKNYSLNINLDT